MRQNDGTHTLIGLRLADGVFALPLAVEGSARLQRTGIPIIHHAAERRFADQLAGLLSEPIFPMEIYMKKPWEITTCEEE